MWVARNIALQGAERGAIYLYDTKPERDPCGFWRKTGGFMRYELGNGYFPELSWEDEPLEVCLLPVPAKTVEIGPTESDWRPCTEEDYPEEDLKDRTLIAYWSESEEVWYHWTYSNCPYGWSNLCRSQAFWRLIEDPI